MGNRTAIKVKSICIPLCNTLIDSYRGSNFGVDNRFHPSIYIHQSMYNIITLHMKTVILLVILCQAGFCLLAQDSIPAPATQIKLALLAAPDDKKDSATVYGYSPNKELVQLRKGTNELICLCDDPAQPGFSVACYHRDLEA